MPLQEKRVLSKHVVDQYLLFWTGRGILSKTPKHITYAPVKVARSVFMRNTYKYRSVSTQQILIYSRYNM